MLLAFATCAAFAATNVDSAALLVAFATTAKPTKVFVAFTAVGACVVAASLALSFLASSVDISARLFGFVPLFVGLSQLVKYLRHGAGESLAPVTTSLAAMIASFLSCSADNLSVFVAMLVRNGPQNAPWTGGLLGMLYVLAGLAGATAANGAMRTTFRLPVLAPSVTAGVGLVMLLR